MRWILAAALFWPAGQAEELVQKLRSDKIVERQEAERGLKKLGPAARPALERAAKDPDVEVAARAMALLRAIELRDHLGPRLIGLLEDREADLLGDASAWTAAFLELTESWEHFRSVDGLRRSELERLFPRAAAGAADTLQKIRVLKAATALELRPVATAVSPWMADPDPDVRKEAAKTLGALNGPDAVPKLLERLSDDSPFVRAAAVRGLGWLGVPAARAAVTKCAGDDDVDVRIAVAEALGGIGNRASLPVLLEFLGDSALGVRAASLRAIVEVRAVDAVSDVLKCLGDEALDVRSQAAAALGALGGTVAVPALRARLADKAPSVRVACARSLALLNAKESLPDLVALLGDPEAPVRGAAADALARLGARESAGAIEALLRDKVSSVRRAAVDAIGRLAADGAVTKLSAALSDEELTVQTEAAGALSRNGHRGGLSLLLKRETGLTSLNALRSSQSWKRLASQTLPVLRRPTVRAVLEAAARSANLTLAWPANEAVENDPWFWRRIDATSPPPTSAAAALADLEDHRYSFVVEERQIQVLPKFEAVRFWTRWAAENR